MFQKIKKDFNPLIFLASLGAGGVAVSAFIIIQYGIFTGKGLATFSQITQTPLSISMEIIMVIFSAIHIALTVLFFSGFSQ